MIKKIIKFLSLSTLLIIAGCSSALREAPVKEVEYKNQVVKVGPIEKITKNIVSRSIPSLTSSKRKILSLNYKKKHYDFWKKYFSKRERPRFIRHLRNGLQYKDIVEKVFTEHGLPKDLFYVGLIESGYNTHIASHANAVGPWQFIKGTATRYGLRVDRYADERRNIYKSSQAAAGYFKDLYNIFGSWELALCAYNAGEYRIINAIRKGNTRDYVELVKKKLIPKETIYYIPKVAAARDLVNAQFQDLKDHKLTSFYNSGERLVIRKSFSANKLRRQLKLSKKQFKLLNPEIKNDWVKVKRKHTLFVPTHMHGLASRFVNNLPKVSKRSLASIKKIKTKVHKKHLSRRVHKVKRGENLSLIAKKYGVTVASLQKSNKLKRGFIHPGQFLNIKKRVSHLKNSEKRGNLKKSKYHTVKRGEFLGKIARQYKMSLSRLKSLNGLRSNKISIGKKLLVSASRIIKDRFYIVRKGDNLYQIARRFGTSVKKLVRKNSLSQKKIYPKQKILIPLRS